MAETCTSKEELSESNPTTDIKAQKGSQWNISEIGNRELRHNQYVKLRKEKKKDKKKRRQERQKEAEALGPENAPAKLIPKTIESMREPDETTVAPGDANEGTWPMSSLYE